MIATHDLLEYTEYGLQLPRKNVPLNRPLLDIQYICVHILYTCDDIMSAQREMWNRVGCIQTELQVLG